MDTLLLAFALVFLAELGDKTQLLTLLLAARWRRLLPIALGLALASFSSHLAASLLGAGLGQLVDPKLTRPIAGIAFLACALWMLWPEGEEGREDAPLARGLWQTTLAALSIYLLAELGDKTQFASVLLALERGEVLPVTAGATPRDARGQSATRCGSAHGLPNVCPARCCAPSPRSSSPRSGRRFSSPPLDSLEAEGARREKKLLQETDGAGLAAWRPLY